MSLTFIWSWNWGREGKGFLWKVQMRILWSRGSEVEGAILKLLFVAHPLCPFPNTWLTAHGTLQGDLTLGISIVLEMGNLSDTWRQGHEVPSGLLLDLYIFQDFHENLHSKWASLVSPDDLPYWSFRVSDLKDLEEILWENQSGSLALS